MRLRAAILVLFMSGLHAGEHRWYWPSVALMAAGSTFDHVSSVRLNGTPGVREWNGLVSSRGRYSVEAGITLKIATGAGLVAIERGIFYFVRRSGRQAGPLYRPFECVNAGLGAAYAGVGFHNLRLRR